MSGMGISIRHQKAVPANLRGQAGTQILPTFDTFLETTGIKIEKMSKESGDLIFGTLYEITRAQIINGEGRILAKPLHEPNGSVEMIFPNQIVTLNKDVFTKNLIRRQFRVDHEYKPATSVAGFSIQVSDGYLQLKE